MGSSSLPEHSLIVVPAYRGIFSYITQARGLPSHERPALWNRYVLEPYWADWAAGQFNEQRARQQLANPPQALDELEVVASELDRSGVEGLVTDAYRRISAELPPPLPEKAVCILALDPANRRVIEQQNGVSGSCVGDNILLQIHTGGHEWQKWVPYVLAHEYNHTITGYVHFYLKGNMTATLLDSMVFEGLADTFARQLNPELEPAWTRALSPEQEVEQWQAAQDVLDSTSSADYQRFIFGSQEPGSPPPFTGYTIGVHIVQHYLARYPDTRMADLVMKNAVELLEWGRYDPMKGKANELKR